MECQYEDTALHLIVWNMEFQIATEMFPSAVKTLNMLLEKKEKSIEFLVPKGRALFLLNRPPEAVPASVNGKMTTTPFYLSSDASKGVRD